MSLLNPMCQPVLSEVTCPSCFYHLRSSDGELACSAPLCEEQPIVIVFPGYKPTCPLYAVLVTP